jgi:predicted glycosyltransferase
VTARDFAQTLELCERLGIDHTAIGHHRGGRAAAKALGLASRSAALIGWARSRPAGPGRRPFDIALGHGSNDVSIAAAVLRVPSSTMFDYEWATVQHNLNCRLARAVVVPDAIPPERLARYGAQGKLRPYEGLKEEYYLADFEPDEVVLTELGLDRSRPIVTVRTPPEVSLYHRFENDLFARLLRRLQEAAREHGLQAVVLPRVASQREELAAAPGLLVPRKAIDAQSLIAFSDLVVSAGGTMNREAVALGTPVYTTFQGRPGAVDDRLIAEGRMHSLRDPQELPLGRREGDGGATRVRRDPALLVELLLSPMLGASSAPAPRSP